MEDVEMDDILLLCLHATPAVYPQAITDVVTAPFWIPARRTQDFQQPRYMIQRPRRLSTESMMKVQQRSSTMLTRPSRTYFHPFKPLFSNFHVGKKPVSLQRPESPWDLGTASESFEGVAGELRTSLKPFEGLRYMSSYGVASSVQRSQATSGQNCRVRNGELLARVRSQRHVSYPSLYGEGEALGPACDAMTPPLLSSYHHHPLVPPRVVSYHARRRGVDSGAGFNSILCYDVHSHNNSRINFLHIAGRRRPTTTMLYLIAVVVVLINTLI
ncbi:hypothetical protein C8J57DRAFT_1482772 [Mycena rebaudengoi]|nr:hypothetical protein C8J57DRAFT_1482772 [Mycena rebaudengoi]